MLAGDTVQMVSDPIFYPSGQTALTNAYLFVQAISAGAGSANLQFSNAWVRFMDPPY